MGSPDQQCDERDAAGSIGGLRHDAAGRAGRSRVDAEGADAYRVAFDRQARATGGNVRWLGQHGLVYTWIQNYKLDPNKGDGLCAGLAIDWLNLKAKPKPGDLITPLREQQGAAFREPPEKRAAIEEFAQELVESHNGQLRIKRALAEFLVLRDTKTFDYPYAKIEAAFAKSRFFYISTDGHSMAALTNAKGVVTFYDPNVGEVSGTSAKFFGPYQKACIDATVMARDTMTYGLHRDSPAIAVALPPPVVVVDKKTVTLEIFSPK